uniref:Uncharacterized protein n=1 Tax=Anguilla anguilla TaxID=7936 RepID=A0A0E9R632_ANGAN
MFTHVKWLNRQYANTYYCKHISCP